MLHPYPRNAAVARYTNPAGYDRFMGRWSARLAPLFADFAGITEGRVLDVGCGTAVLSRVLLDRSPTIEVVGIDPARSYLGPCAAVDPLVADRVRLHYR